MGAYGVSPDLSGPGKSIAGYSHVQFVSNFIMTNPSCDKPIKIKRVQVMDQDGTVVFAEGPGTYTITHTHPIYGTTWTTTVVIPDKLDPHQSWGFSLADVIRLPGIGYGDPGYTPEQTPRIFTMEIGWKGGEKTPLIGVTKQMAVGWIYGKGHDVLGLSETPMVTPPLDD